MKFSALLIVIVLFGCKEKAKPTTEPAREQNKSINAYPEALQNVLEAHGGLEAWRSQKTLQFTMPTENGKEVHTTDLRSRKDRIEGPGYSLGFDGNTVWLLNPDGAYEGDPVFYHNLMFYFYAMPFVLADGGIEYSQTVPLEFEGSSFPGIRITYEDGVGTSPKDEYFLYYDPGTFHMTWLGYTVTYFSGSVSDDLHWINYSDWMEVDGLLLPAAMTWYNYEDSLPTTVRNTVNFEAVAVSQGPKPTDFYQVPAGAEIAQ